MKKKHIRIIHFVLPVMIVLYILTIYRASLPAQIADAVLRPGIGNKNTIMLESVYFNLTDQINQVQSSIKTPDSYIFTSNIPGISPQVDTHPTLSTIVSIPVRNNFLPLSGEGVWQPIPQTLFPDHVVMDRTFVRPDATRDYAIVSLVQMDMQKLAINIEAGTYYPGGTHRIYGSGIVPKTIQQSNQLVAVFNGGFMEEDGHYGMIVGNKTYVPLRKGLATVIISASGSAQIIDYERQSLRKDTISIRQNGAFLVKNGAITPFVENGLDTWGRTTTNSMYTWRSGIGITKNGNLLYAVGNSLIPQTLAQALQEAGAVNAMQLDINSFWDRFVLYTPLGSGRYSYYPLLKDMQNSGYAYLNGYNKDFFYIYKKSSY